jgi:predicted metal-binding membrane protein
MMMWATDRRLTATLLIVAGLYQLSPLKQACLTQCRSPVEFLARNWRPGRSGAFRLGLLHGAYCLGCCWALMLLLFAAGIMNLVWIAGLAILVLLEKLAPFGSALTKPLAALLILGGGALLLPSQ